MWLGETVSIRPSFPRGLCPVGRERMWTGGLAYYSSSHPGVSRWNTPFDTKKIKHYHLVTYTGRKTCRSGLNKCPPEIRFNAGDGRHQTEKRKIYGRNRIIKTDRAE